MSCWIIPSHLGSGYLPEPTGFSFPCRSLRWSTYACAPFKPVSSLFQSTKRIDRSVTTSGALKTRASSMTSAVPEPSSFAAAPKPWPSMWPPTIYISSGWAVPTLVQNTSSRGPGVSGSALIRRSAVSGCSSGFMFTPVGARVPLTGLESPPRPLWPPAPSAAALRAPVPRPGAALSAALGSGICRRAYS